MANRKNQKQIGIPDTLAMCSLYALLLALFFIPGIIIDGHPVSAMQLSQAVQAQQFGAFPRSVAAARELFAAPLLSAIGLVVTLLLTRSSGKYAFGACLSLLLFGMIGAYQTRYLPAAGGFVLGAAMFISLVLFFVSLVCAVIRKK